MDEHTAENDRRCDTPGCPGDGRYFPPGRGHNRECTRIHRDALTGATTLTDFLLARIAEDEEVAKEATDRGFGRYAPDSFDSPHQARWLPSRVLAECEAKRRIVLQWEHFTKRAAQTAAEKDERRGFYHGLAMGCHQAVLELAAVYAGHSDYDEMWRP